jgi:hypothetical protein
MNFDKGEAGAVTKPGPGKKTSETVSQKIFDEPPAPGGEWIFESPAGLAYLLKTRSMNFRASVLFAPQPEAKAEGAADFGKLADDAAA